MVYCKQGVRGETNVRRPVALVEGVATRAILFLAVCGASCAAAPPEPQYGGGVANAETAKDLERACELGDEASCKTLEDWKTNRRPVVTDGAKGRAHAKARCDADDAISCSELGALYVFGRGVPVDHPRAVVLYEKACRLGHAAGCWRLGRLLMEGQGVSHDRNRAARAFRDSCERGHRNGCVEIRRLRAINR